MDYESYAMTNDSCSEAYCFEPVAWERVTQFAGTHPYCDKCARKEKDFGKEDGSYSFWREVKVAKPKGKS